MPERYRGLPRLEMDECVPGCNSCAKSCPTGAISCEGGISLDLGKCLFCTACERACKTGAIRMSGDYRISATKRDDLVLRPGKPVPDVVAMTRELRGLFGRSLKLRQVSAGGCNACEADLNVLSTIVFDLGRFGIQFVASPRHADGIVITGPVTANMKLALEKTWAAVPSPKIAIAVGACAISGGLFATGSGCNGGAGGIIPVDLFVPGCPPHPYSILDALLKFKSC